MPQFPDDLTREFKSVKKSFGDGTRCSGLGFELRDPGSPKRLGANLPSSQLACEIKQESPVSINHLPHDPFDLQQKACLSS
jgi:hypothetical protein